MRKYKFYLENGETFEIEAGTVSFDDIDLAQTNAEKISAYPGDLVYQGVQNVKAKVLTLYWKGSVCAQVRLEHVIAWGTLEGV